LPRVGGALSARSRQYHGAAASMSNAPKLDQCRSGRGSLRSRARQPDVADGVPGQRIDKTARTREERGGHSDDRRESSGRAAPSRDQAKPGDRYPVVHSLYTVALILVVIVTGRGDAHVSKAITIALAALVVVAAIFDVLENRAVAAVADHLAASSVADGLTADFWLYAVGKWSLVGLVFVAAGTMNLMQRTALRQFGGGLMIVIGMSIATELLVYGADRLGYR
jgi:hypothetical protein